MNETEQTSLIRRIASVVGHELRNPMAVINNSAYFVRAKLGGSSLDPKVEKHLKIIESEIARADRLIGDMLTFSRAYEPQFETKDFDAEIKAAVAAYAAPAGGKVDFKAGAKGAEAKVDAKALSDSVRRLLDNAFDAMEGKGKVSVATGVEKSNVFLTVADAGPGVDVKVATTLFDPFVTTKPRGLGLGLSLTRKLTAAAGGELSVSSTPKGATFKLVLPKA
ncbi:MAG: HAMP domain-containing histidine kinase [Elusimicrobia bacterium]|nr:HAMP domain-containing histidine kinase [Elusimicrobiota bacterium]